MSSEEFSYCAVHFPPSLEVHAEPQQQGPEPLQSPKHVMLGEATAFEVFTAYAYTPQSVERITTLTASFIGFLL